MLIYENRTPDGTLNKLNDGKCQRNQTQEHKYSQKWRNLLYFFSIQKLQMNKSTDLLGQGRSLI